MTVTTRPTPFADLAASLDGELIAPDSARYEELRQVFIGDVDPLPAAIARVANAEDVARAVTFAKDHALDLTVRSGGHSDFGQRNANGGLVIDLRDLNAIDIDDDAKTAWVDTGATAVEVTKAVWDHGLLVGFGDTGSVGVGGITLGGGIGYLTRKYGLTIDSLLAAELVTEDGAIHQVDEDREPDLFWAIRGGGGNFGVATRFQYQLHAVPSVYGGMLILPATAETVDGFLREAAAATEELSTIANVMPAPPMPFLPPDLVGKTVILAFMVNIGDAAAGEKAMAPFRALAKPLADMLKPMQYPEIYMPEDPNYRPTPVQRTMFLDRVDRDIAQTMLDALAASDAPLRAVQLRYLGGEFSRIPEDATAFAHRKAAILAVVVNFYDLTPADRAKRVAWLDDLSAKLRQGEDRAYVNFLTVDDDARLGAAYPPKTLARLRVIKKRYDPTNLFRGNVNIPPN